MTKGMILIVEDDAKIRRPMVRVLRKNGFDTLEAETVDQAYTYLEDYRCDLIVLDLGLPDGDGSELLQHIRSDRDDIPVIVVTAVDKLHSKLDSFDSGADDYIVKPFDLTEFAARVGRHMKRSKGITNIYECDELTIDFDRRTCTVSGSEVILDRQEFDILQFMARSDRVGKHLPYDHIYDNAWPADIVQSEKRSVNPSDLVRRHISNIRRKLNPTEPERFIQSSGLGYRLRTP